MTCLFSVLVLDNAGLELIGDLCLLTYLMETGLIKTANIYVKTRPWFVSDTTNRDFNYTLEELRLVLRQLQLGNYKM